MNKTTERKMKMKKQKWGYLIFSTLSKIYLANPRFQNSL